MEDMDSKQWIRKQNAVPSNAIGVGEFFLLDLIGFVLVFGFI